MGARLTIIRLSQHTGWVLAAVCWAGLGSVYAHPMGNFSISHYAQLTLEGRSIGLVYIIDMAEIPTFQERSLIDLNSDGNVDLKERNEYLSRKAPQLTEGLVVRLNGSRIKLNQTAESIDLIPSTPNLPTLRLVLKYSISSDTFARSNNLEYRDTNFAERPGWKEIVVRAGPDVEIVESSAASQDSSQQLTRYPEDPDVVPPQDLTASVKFTSAEAELLDSSSSSTKVSGGAGSETGRRALSEQQRLMGLLASASLNPNIMAVALLVAFGLGAFHALSPGHGKTVVGAYLVGSKGTGKDAILLGLIVTITHTLGVFLLGLVTLYASKYILPERLYPWLGFVSGLGVVAIGFVLFLQRYRMWYEHSHSTHTHAANAAHSHSHLHSHDHSHGHETTEHVHAHSGEHTHAAGMHSHGGITHTHDYANVKFRDLFTLGVTGGMVPCPSALVVLLGAISLNRVGLGLLLIVAFSFGLAIVLMVIGLMMVYARGFMEKLSGGGRVWRIVPVFSALAVAVLGAVIAVQSLVSGGIVQIHLSLSQ